jgi:hypothetical protein
MERNNLLQHFLHWEHTTSDAVFLNQPLNGIWITVAGKPKATLKTCPFLSDT